MIRGSCLCGEVRFEIEGPIHSIGMCHCSRCRKASGVASNATFMVSKQHFRWVAGEDGLGSYALPSGFRTSFCSSCGCPAPDLHPSGGAYWVLAGSLDDDPGIEVAMHIFVGSRASWDEIAGDATQYQDDFPSPTS